jgi:hypothetical protein
MRLHVGPERALDTGAALRDGVEVLIFAALSGG